MVHHFSRVLWMLHLYWLEIVVNYPTFGTDDVGPLNEYALGHSVSEVCALLDIDVA
jgi:hypothetical protein